jgi:hypothetical protein
MYALRSEKPASNLGSVTNIDPDSDENKRGTRENEAAVKTVQDTWPCPVCGALRLLSFDKTKMYPCPNIYCSSPCKTVAIEPMKAVCRYCRAEDNGDPCADCLNAQQAT